MHKSRRILIVEDSPTAAKALSSLVQSLGFEVDLVSDAERAIARASCNDYALVLMDLRLPGPSGFVAARGIRADGNNVPIISVTAYPLDTDAVRCAEAGIDDCVCKGYRRDELENVIMLLANANVGKDTVLCFTRPRQAVSYQPA